MTYRLIICILLYTILTNAGTCSTVSESDEDSLAGNNNQDSKPLINIIQHKPPNVNEDICTVCLEDINENNNKCDNIIYCNYSNLHVFHATCFLSAFNSARNCTCPICRTDCTIVLTKYFKKIIKLLANCPEYRTQKQGIIFTEFLTKSNTMKLSNCLDLYRYSQKELVYIREEIINTQNDNLANYIQIIDNAINAVKYKSMSIFELCEHALNNKSLSVDFYEAFQLNLNSEFLTKLDFEHILKLIEILLIKACYGVNKKYFVLSFLMLVSDVTNMCNHVDNIYQCIMVLIQNKAIECILGIAIYLDNKCIQISHYQLIDLIKESIKVYSSPLALNYLSQYVDIFNKNELDENDYISIINAFLINSNGEKICHESFVQGVKYINFNRFSFSGVFHFMELIFEYNISPNINIFYYLSHIISGFEDHEIGKLQQLLLDTGGISHIVKFYNMRIYKSMHFKNNDLIFKHVLNSRDYQAITEITKSFYLIGIINQDNIIAYIETILQLSDNYILKIFIYNIHLMFRKSYLSSKTVIKIVKILLDSDSAQYIGQVIALIKDISIFDTLPKEDIQKIICQCMNNIIKCNNSVNTNNLNSMAIFYGKYIVLFLDKILTHKSLFYNVDDIFAVIWRCNKLTNSISDTEATQIIDCLSRSDKFSKYLILFFSNISNLKLCKQVKVGLLNHIICQRNYYSNICNQFTMDLIDDFYKSCNKVKFLIDHGSTKLLNQLNILTPTSYEEFISNLDPIQLVYKYITTT